MAGAYSLKFHRITQNQHVIDYLSDKLTKLLQQNDNVLWLVPGGSAAEIAVRTLNSLPAELTNRLTLSLTDERYGPVGHADSNWHKLAQAGLDTKRAVVLQCLEGEELQETTAAWSRKLLQSSGLADYKIALLGIGADGHTSGVLPGSPGVESKSPAISFAGPDFTRITTTLNFLAKLDEAVAFAAGQEKLPALVSLRDKNLPLNEQPAQVLKSVPRALIFSDVIG